MPAALVAADDDEPGGQALDRGEPDRGATSAWIGLLVRLLVAQALARAITATAETAAMPETLFAVGCLLTPDGRSQDAE